MIITYRRGYACLQIEIPRMVTQLTNVMVIKYLEVVKLWPTHQQGNCYWCHLGKIKSEYRWFNREEENTIVQCGPIQILVHSTNKWYNYRDAQHFGSPWHILCHFFSQFCLMKVQIQCQILNYWNHTISDDDELVLSGVTLIYFLALERMGANERIVASVK